MFCPNCGQENSTEQKFCRKCGLNLEKSAASLVEQMPEGLLPGTGDRRLEMLGNIAFGGLGLVVVAGVAGMIYVIAQKFILSGTGVVTGIFFILLLIFAMLGLTYVVLNESRKEKRLSNRIANKPEAIESPDTARLLETGDFQPVSSVVEDTTDLLKIEAKTRKL
jgi:hypothetical protein